MTVVTIHQAKTNLSKLIAAVLAGEEVVIARGKTRVVRLIPDVPADLPEPAPRRQPGRLKGLMGDIPPEAFAPMSDEELREWGLA